MAGTHRLLAMALVALFPFSMSAHAQKPAAKTHQPAHAKPAAKAKSAPKKSNSAKSAAINPTANLEKPAKVLFGAKTEPAHMQARAVGFYAKGCLAGAQALPITGDTWQVMRLSRNRNWGHPNLVAMLERLAEKARKVGWNGLLVGDMSQPRGGPMLTGHASHQVGLDADIWLTPMPDRTLTRQERETISATMIVAPSRLDVDPKVWTPAHVAVVKAAAEDPLVERIFVNAAIKKALCRDAGRDHSWLHKVRPYWGHDYHMHVRIKCPEGSTNCKSQPPPPDGDGCATKDLAWWFREGVIHPKPPTKPVKPKPPITLADLPADCRQVLLAQ
jgi:penicillin-insensitive murein endopeptidase